MNKVVTSENIDKVICAENPDKDKNRKLYHVVQEYMIHGPCGSINPQSPCMIHKKCSKFYPKNYNNTTCVDEEGFLIYKRRMNDRYVEKDDVKLNNMFIVP